MILPDAKDLRGFDHPAPSTLPAGVLLDYMYGCAVVLQWGKKSFHDFLRHRAPPSLAAAGSDAPPKKSTASSMAREERAIERESGEYPGDNHHQVRTGRQSPSQDEVLDWLLYISKRLRRGDRDDGDLAQLQAEREIWKQTEIKERSASHEKVENWLSVVTGSSAPYIYYTLDAPRILTTPPYDKSISPQALILSPRLRSSS
jgi:hypothetical protein